MGKVGAGSRDRTGILSLEGCCTTIVLYPRDLTASSCLATSIREVERGVARVLQQNRTRSHARTCGAATGGDGPAVIARGRQTPRAQARIAVAMDAT
jgi:hypothetical protein